ncbi:Mitochondrial oxaloacetate carrier protein [Naganishia albida]|nr:Mitochondrial oxaloacetate carrier protein [Naganishia albida]
MSNLPVHLPPPQRLTPLPAVSLPEAFLCGGLAGCAAVTVSNIPEVMKTRLQLQGELIKTSDAPKVYKNVFDVFRKTWANEGLRGLQRGLGPAYAYQILLNGSRLGFYEPIRKRLNRLAGYGASDQLAWSSVTAGAGSGIIGATLGNPLFLIKARMQAYSPALPVGAQHHYRSSFHALSEVVKNEGKLGLVRGVGSAMLRTAMGSSVQLPSYNYAKRVLTANGYTAENSYWTYLASSSFSGICVCLVMQPADTALTRVYNQPTITGPDGRTRGALYSNPFDCLWKTLKTEGFFGWYKGTTAHFLRIAPHTVITLVANELILEQYKKWKHET